MDYKLRLIHNRRSKGTKSTDPNPTVAPVEIEITIKGKRTWRSTGVRVYTNQWRDGMVIKRPDARHLNEEIRKAYDEAEERCRYRLSSGQETYGAKAVERINVCDWLDEQVKANSEIKDSTRKHHRTMAASFRESGLFSTFDSLTPANILKWDEIIRAKGITQQSIHNYHKSLKPYLNKAVLLGYLDQSPYSRVKTPKGKSKEREYLTEEERTAIENLTLDGTTEFVRDLFIFSCYTGLAFSDAIRAQEMIVQEGGKYYIDGARMKTDTHFRLPLLPKALEILDRWEWDMNRITNQKANFHLKIIKAAAGIRKNLTTHVARHTFATWALSRQIPIEIVSKMLAHTDIKTTQIYAKVMQRDVEAAFGKLAD